jgi:hypothetical protein
MVFVSRAGNAGGEEVGHLVADRLGFVRVDGVDRCSRGSGPADVADEERCKSRQREGIGAGRVRAVND